MKTIVIPSHIINSGDDSHWFNILNGYGNRIGSLAKSGNNINVSNIRLSQLMDVLGESGSLADVLTSDNINQNSYYKTNKTGVHSMGEMAGYNHLAKPSTYFVTKWESGLELNIAPDGVDWMVTVPVELRRGEIIPSYSDNVLSWSGIKVIVKLWEDVEIDPTLYETIIMTGINVSTMRNSTTVNVEIPVTNDNETYKLEIRAYYTYGGSDIEIEDGVLWVHLTTVERVPFSLAVQTPILAFSSPGSSYVFNCLNDIAESGNAEPYIENFRVVCTGYFGVDPETADTFYGYSPVVSIYAQETEEVTATFDPEIRSDLDTALEYSITIYYDSGGDTWVQLYQFIWNTGVTP